MVHYAAALLLGLSVTHVFSQSTTAILAELPTCAQQPLIEGFAASGCAATDTACICNDNNLIESLQAAVKSACDAADQASMFKTPLPLHSPRPRSRGAQCEQAALLTSSKRS